MSAAAPAPEQQGHCTTGFGSKLKTTGRGHADTAYLTDDSSQAFVTKPFFHDCQGLLIVAALSIDQPVG